MPVKCQVPFQDSVCELDFRKLQDRSFYVPAPQQRPLKRPAGIYTTLYTHLLGRQSYKTNGVTCSYTRTLRCKWSYTAYGWTHTQTHTLRVKPQTPAGILMRWRKGHLWSKTLCVCVHCTVWDANCNSQNSPIPLDRRSLSEDIWLDGGIYPTSTVTDPGSGLGAICTHIHIHTYLQGLTMATRQQKMRGKWSEVNGRKTKTGKDKRTGGREKKHKKCKIEK